MESAATDAGIGLCRPKPPPAGGVVVAAARASRLRASVVVAAWRVGRLRLRRKALREKRA